MEGNGGITIAAIKKWFFYRKADEGNEIVFFKNDGILKKPKQFIWALTLNNHIYNLFALYTLITPSFSLLTTNKLC